MRAMLDERTIILDVEVGIYRGNIQKYIGFFLSLLVTGKEGFGPGDQDWGYYEVRPGAHMFYWLYYTKASSDRPLVIWLQGGPGSSSAGYGNFQEIGLLDIDLKERNTSWVNEVNVLYIDNPVGSGFSYVESDDLLVSNNQQIATDLVNFTRQFMNEHSQFRTTPTYIFTESYGGKMTVEFALYLQKDIEAGNVQANLKGVALGDSWISPLDYCMSYADYLLNTGMVDYEGYEKINEAAQRVKGAVESERWVDALFEDSALLSLIQSEAYGANLYNILCSVPAGIARLQSTNIDGTFIATIINYGNACSKKIKSDRLFFANTTGFTTFFSSSPKRSDGTFSLGCNLSQQPTSCDFGTVQLAELMNGQVRDKLGVPSNLTWTFENLVVYAALVGDLMKPVNHIVERLLNETSLNVVVYTGQLDLMIDPPGSLRWVQRLQWPGAEGWRNAAREPLSVNGVLEGYVKSHLNLSFYWIARAGHMVPSDNPYAALELLRQVTHYS
ncbi:retinoid-inducible serine carboxypeptidase-like [Anabrus simplex]|uniref:retinoid-inducible serine carboxypeptidase-like n=1 Tax=Anabrus simplex TaxID=316456 RepID=UPI0035A35E4A